LRGSISQHFEHILDANTHTPDARASPALGRIHGNSVNTLHNSFILPDPTPVNAWFGYNPSTAPSAFRSSIFRAPDAPFGTLLLSHLLLFTSAPSKGGRNVTNLLQ
jgi:hypothetical protein